MNASPDPVDPSGLGTEEVKDPGHDLTASYASSPAYVAGLTDHVVATSGESVTAYCPFNGQPLGVVPQSTEADVEEAFERARRAQQAWAQTSIDERAAVMLRLHDLVLDRQAEIIDLICWESGKARKHAFDEPLHVALTARYYARTGARAPRTAPADRRRARCSPTSSSTGTPRASSGSSRRGTTRSRWRSATASPR